MPIINEDMKDIKFIINLMSFKMQYFLYRIVLCLVCIGAQDHYFEYLQ